MQISESDMLFGNFRPEQVFLIENSKIHTYVGEGIKSVEFVLLNAQDRIFFVEAKSSSPKSETSIERYEEFLTEITEKFIHSFHMFVAWHLGRIEDEGEVGSDFSKIPYAHASFVFVLVIRGHKASWLYPLQEELNRKLRYHRSIWKSRVIVMNEVIAKQYQLIV